jgi:hypothetical protein
MKHPGPKAPIVFESFPPDLQGFTVLLLRCLLAQLSSCSGRGSGSTGNTGNQTPSAPAVSLSLSPETIVPGERSTLTWSTTNASTCSASGAWTGLAKRAGCLLALLFFATLPLVAQTGPCEIYSVSQNNVIFGPQGSGPWSMQNGTFYVYAQVMPAEGYTGGGCAPATFTVNQPQIQTSQGVDTVPLITVDSVVCYGCGSVGIGDWVFDLTVAQNNSPNELVGTLQVSEGATTVSINIGDNGTGALNIVNPFEPILQNWGTSGPQIPANLNPFNAADSSPMAGGIVADGQSAALITFQSNSSSNCISTTQAPSLSLSVGQPGGVAYPSSLNSQVGSLGDWSAQYLYSPSPPAPGVTQITMTPAGQDPTTGNCLYLALYWAPAQLPMSVSNPNIALNSLQDLPITITASQGSMTLQQTISLYPPPLLLVHGIWSSPNAAWQGFQTWLETTLPNTYSPNLIYPVDYSQFNSLAFSDPNIQAIFLQTATNAIAIANGNGVIARDVDVFAHSMGGLVTQYFLDNLSGPPYPFPLTATPVHRFIEVGTPNTGTDLATDLYQNQNSAGLNANPVIVQQCELLATNPCTLGEMFARMLNKPIASGVLSLEPPGLPPNSASNYDAISGSAQSYTATENRLDIITEAFLPGAPTIQTLLQLPDSEQDTIVPLASQLGNAQNSYTADVGGIVHTALASGDTGETQSQVVWNQALWWLMGESGGANFLQSSTSDARTNASSPTPEQSSTSAPAPILDLTGYSQVPSSTATFTPASGSTLTINSTTNITVSSPDTISEVLLFQQVSDPSDISLLYSTESPFTIPFTPTRVGTTQFLAFVVYSNQTYSTTTLSYTFQPNGAPAGLKLTNAPSMPLVVGATTTVGAEAYFNDEWIDVSQLATYTTASGNSNVFSVSPGGTVTATGAGIDSLNVSYGGYTTSAQISVGGCSFTIGANNPFVDANGGSTQVQVTTASSCAWTASDGDSWVTLSNASGSGNGAFTLTASPNSSGNIRTTILSLAGQSLAVTQLACAYSISQSQINAPSTGTSGSISVTTTCPILASTNSSWISISVGASSVNYTIAPNSAASALSGTIAIGDQTVDVMEAAGTPATAPIFSIAPGTYTSAQTVAISDSTPGATIYYTTDGTTPTTSSAVYATPIQVNSTETIQAIATASGYSQSAVASAAYTINLTASSPTFSPAGGTYSSPQTVTISDSTSGATIYYTTDGTMPTSSSTVYAGPITVNSSETVEAIATASGYSQSAIASASYTINLAAAATPTFSPGGGTYPSAQTVTISDTTQGAIIYYTINGTTPTSSSTVYSGAITVSSTETIEAIALASGYSQSVVASATYTISLPAATPTFSVAPGTYNSAQMVAISDSTQGAVIYYTINGSTPTTASAVYSGPITVSSTETIEAIAVASGYSQSVVATATYTISIPVILTPTVRVSPSSSSVSTDQALSVTVTVAGGTGNPVPTGSVTLSSTSYSSGATTLSNGSATVNIPAGSLSLGNDTLTANYAPDAASSTLYTSGSGTAPVTVTNASFSMSATAVTVNPGTPGTSTVTISSTNGYSGTVSLTCAITSSPAGATDSPTCTANQTVTLSSTTTSETATVTVNSTAASAALSRPQAPSSGARGAAGGAALALILLPWIARRRRNWFSLLVLAFLLMLIEGVSACGGGGGGGTTPITPSNPGTTAGGYTVTVTGTGNDSAKTTELTTFTLTVN